MKVKEMPVSLYYQVKYSFFGLGGLNTKKNDSVPVIVSLTSIPSRFKKLHLGIKSILDQSVLPEKIVLWLNESQRGKIPKSLEKLKGSIFEIRYSQLDCSHLKLVESLKHFPNKIIRSEEHTSELQSRENLVCRLLLEKKK